MSIDRHSGPTVTYIACGMLYYAGCMVVLGGCKTKAETTIAVHDQWDAA